MTDRELLENAAKAAGLGSHRYCEPWSAMAAYTLYDGYHGPSWNPLADDGDALRLLVRLGSAKVAAMEIGPGGTCLSFFHPEADADEMQEPGKPFDPYAATRRAIVRAAAEIGRSDRIQPRR
jgi:hypothetical protein